MKPKVAIGLTTHVDISAPDYGAAVFEAYAAVSDRITPNWVRIHGTTYPTPNAAAFADLWLTLAPFEISERRRGPVIERGVYRIGAEWRRTGALSGTGQVFLRPETDPQQPDGLILEHNFSTRIDWLDLFKRLIGILKPAHGMLHLFTDAERPPLKTWGEIYFDGPVWGERHFTGVRSSLGNWSHPPPWDPAARRRYRYMHQLSWANYLGPEFAGSYDREALAAKAHASRDIGDGLFVQLTPALADIEQDYRAFDTARAAAKTAFAPDFFRL